jgi:hypothetical protein
MKWLHHNCLIHKLSYLLSGPSLPVGHDRKWGEGLPLQTCRHLVGLLGQRTDPLQASSYTA